MVNMQMMKKKKKIRMKKEEEGNETRHIHHPRDEGKEKRKREPRDWSPSIHSSSTHSHPVPSMLSEEEKKGARNKAYGEIPIAFNARLRCVDNYSVSIILLPWPVSAAPRSSEEEKSKAETKRSPNPECLLCRLLSQMHPLMKTNVDNVVVDGDHHGDDADDGDNGALLLGKGTL